MAKELSTRENTNLLKQYLSNRFNGLKFSIRTPRYSKLEISYDLGPEQSIVQNIINNLQHGNFNGMEDIYEYSDTQSIQVAGKTLNTFNYVSVNQYMPNWFEYKLAQLFSNMASFANTPKLLSEDQLHLFMPQSDFGHTWGNLLLKYFKSKNFVTNDPNKIELLSCHWTEKELKHDEIFFKYMYNGKEYDTKTFPKRHRTPVIKQNETKTQPIETSNTGFTADNLKNIQLIDYSDKSFALIGEDTKIIKDIIKEAGGNFNKYLTINDEKVPGWIFSINKSKEIYNLIKQLKGL